MSDSGSRGSKNQGTPVSLKRWLESHRPPSDGKGKELTPKRKRGTAGKAGNSPGSDEEKRRAKKEKEDRETKWMSEKEKKMWEMMEKKMEVMSKDLREELMEIWDYETHEWEKQIEERDNKIRELEEEIRILKGKAMEEAQNVMSEEEEEEENEVTDESWAKVVRKKKKRREEIIEALNDFNVQRKVVEVSEEVKDKKQREKNIVVKGWSEINCSSLKEDDKRDAMKMGKVLLSKYLSSETESQEAEWYGKEDRKILVLKMKSREDKNEVIKRRNKLQGTKIFLEDDLTREERKKQQKLLKVRKDLISDDRENKVWIRKGKMRINGKWFSYERIRKMQLIEKEKLAREEESEDEIEEDEKSVPDQQGDKQSKVKQTESEIK